MPMNSRIWKDSGTAGRVRRSVFLHLPYYEAALATLK